MRSIEGVFERGNVQSVYRIWFDLLNTIYSYSCTLPAEVDLIFSSHSSRQK
jgi:hypothetical protein